MTVTDALSETFERLNEFIEYLDVTDQSVVLAGGRHLYRCDLKVATSLAMKEVASTAPQSVVEAATALTTLLSDNARMREALEWAMPYARNQSTDDEGLARAEAALAKDESNGH